MKILISAGYAGFLNSLVKYLETTCKDVEIRGCQYTEQAIQEIENGFQPDVILTDYKYPFGKLNGDDYLKTLRTKGITAPAFLIIGSVSNEISNAIRRQEFPNIPDVVVVRKDWSDFKKAIDFIHNQGILTA